MKVGFLNSIESETYGGMEEWIRMVALGLVERKHTVTLMGRPNSEYLRRTGEDLRINAIPLNISGDFNPSTILKIKNLIQENKFDLLVVNFNKDIRLGGIAARLFGNLPIIWSAGTNLTKDALIHRFLTPKLIDGIIVPSQSLKDQIVASGYIDEKLVKIIPIGIKLPSHNHDKKQAGIALRNKYKLPQDAIVSVTVGRLIHKKAQDYLITALPDIVKDHPNLYCLLVGDGPQREMFEEKAKSLNVYDRIRITGMLDDVMPVLAGADLMIHPSKEEPFGIVLLEGMCYGLPIAASRIGGIPEVVAEGETALLFEPENSSSLYNMVNRLLSKKEIFNSFSISGYQRVRDHFSFDLMIDRVENYFHKVLKDSNVIGA